MSSINLDSIQNLEDLNLAFGSFQQEAREILRILKQENIRTKKWLGERQRFWRRETERRGESTRIIKIELARCLADRDRDCSEYSQDFHRARRRFDEAKTELRNVRRWSKSVDEAIYRYQRQEKRLNQLVEGDIPKARNFLNKRTSELQQYISAVSGMTTASISTSMPAINVKDDPVSTSDIEGILDFSNEFEQDMASFLNQEAELFDGELPEDLLLVRYHPQEDPGGKWWTSTDQANILNRLDPDLEDDEGEVHHSLAIDPIFHGGKPLKFVTLIKIPAGTQVTYYKGYTAKHGNYPGGGYQYRLKNFDSKWVVETGQIPGKLF